MNRIGRKSGLRSRRVPPAWRMVAASLAAFFVMGGASKLLALRGGPADLLGPLTPWIGGAEVAGGLMLLAPGLVTHAAVLLGPVVGLIAALVTRTAGWPAAIPAAVVLIALATLGLARRPGALLRARLDRAIDRVVRLEESRSGRACREDV